MSEDERIAIRRRAERWSNEQRAVRGEEMPAWHSDPEETNDLLTLAGDALKLLDEIERQ